MQHAGCSSLTRDQTPGPLHWEHGVLTTGPPGKSLRNTFCKAVAAVDSDSSDGSGQLKTFWKMKNICDSWEEVKISTLTGVWKKLIPTVMDDLEGFKT